jgi:hypothetical protein
MMKRRRGIKRKKIRNAREDIKDREKARIGLTSHSIQNVVGLLHQVDLQSHKVVRVRALVQRDRDDGEEIDEGLPVLLVVEERELGLLAIHDGLLDLVHHLLLREGARGSRDDDAVGGLQEAAVFPHDLCLRVSRELLKRLGDVHDRVVPPPRVRDQKGAG